MAANSEASIQTRSVIEYGMRRTIVTLAVILATLLEIIDTTIINVALPTIQGNLGANIEEGSFIVTGYIVANVVVLPLSPWLSERFGRRAYFFASIFLFTFASIMCGLSNSLVSLVLWRIVQGAGGGGLISTSQAILRETYPPKLQGMAQGIFTLGVIVGPTVGPTLGGIITDNLSWRWIFFINVPLGIIAMTLVAIFLRNPIDAHKKNIDAMGISLLAIGLGALQYVLDQGQEKDWFDSPVIMSLTAVAVVGVIGFLLWELFGTREPIVRLNVLRHRSVSASSTMGFVLGLTLTASLVTLPQFVQGQLGFTATLSGELVFVRAIAVMVLTPVSVMLATNPNIDLRYIIGFGFSLVGIANLLQSQITTTDSTFFTFVIAMLVGGCGLAFTFVPLSLAVFSGLEQREIPGAAAFFNLARQLGGSVGTAMLVTYLARSIAFHQSALASAIRPERVTINTFFSGQKSDADARRKIYPLVTSQATTLAYADASQLTGIVTLCTLPIVFLIRRKSMQSGEAAKPLEVH